MKSSVSWKHREKYTGVDEILYFRGRLSPENPFCFEDLYNISVLDAQKIAGPVPVYLVNSPIVYAFVDDVAFCLFR